MFRTTVMALALAGAPMAASASIGQHWGSGLTTAQARGIALGQVPGGAIISGIRLREPGGRMVYRFGVRARGSVAVVQVDAMTGAAVRAAR